MENKRKALNLELYKKIYLIRQTEEVIRRHYVEDEMKTPMHMSMGAEAISAGVCHALGKGDKILSSYRSHAAYLSKTGDTDKFFAELYGRQTGTSKGKTGSMHLSSPKDGYLIASAVVGTPIPVALGAAFAGRQKGRKTMVAVFFGDGAVDEGVFWESLNLAALWKLPVIFVCEDNNLAIHTPVSLRHGYRSLPRVVSRFECNVLSSDTTDVEKIYLMTRRAIELNRGNGKPAFLHLRYYRYLEHVGVNEDFDAGYRSRKEFEKWLKKDPVASQRKKLLAAGVDADKLNILESHIDKRIEKSVFRARRAPFPRKEELFKDVYA